MVGHHNANKQRKAMTSKESRTLRFTLSAEVIGNENATHSIIGELMDIKANYSKDVAK